MKKIIVLTLAMSLSSMVSFGSKRKQPDPDFVKILHSNKYTLFMKVNPFFVGGTVEVYDASGKFLEADHLPDRLTKIFFDDAPKGKYIIRVTKGGMSFEFEHYYS